MAVIACCAITLWPAACPACLSLLPLSLTRVTPPRWRIAFLSLHRHLSAPHQRGGAERDSGAHTEVCGAACRDVRRRACRDVHMQDGCTGYGQAGWRMQRCAKHVGHACHMQIDRDRPFLHAWALALLGGATPDPDDGQTSQRDTIQHQLLDLVRRQCLRDT